jgi:ATP-dependent DNA helicase RecG
MYAAQVDQALSLPVERAVGQLLTIPESQWYERKSGRIHPRDLAPTLVAFANAEGGTAVVGLSEGSVDGVTLQKANDLRQAAHDFTTPVVRTKVTELSEDRKSTRLNSSHRLTSRMPSSA